MKELEDKILNYLNQKPPLVPRMRLDIHGNLSRDSNRKIIYDLHPFKTGLHVLDNRYRKYYTGVTLNYITYDLLKAKYRKSDVAKCLKELHLNGKIKSLRCPDIKQVVFENNQSMHVNYVRGGYGSTNIEVLHEYLNQFIKDEQ